MDHGPEQRGLGHDGSYCIKTLHIEFYVEIDDQEKDLSHGNQGK